MIQNAQLSKGAKEARLPGALRPTILEWDRFAVSEGYRLAANQAKTLKFVLSRQVSFFFLQFVCSDLPDVRQMLQTKINLSSRYRKRGPGLVATGGRMPGCRV